MSQHKVVKTARINNEQFQALVKNARWSANTIYEKATGKSVSNPDKIMSKYTYLDVDAVQALTLHRGIGKKFISIDERLVGQNMILHRSKIIKYETDGFMKRHSDARYDKKMAGRLIFIPPASLFKYEGGTLTLYTNPVTHVNQEDKDEGKWTIVFLPYDTPHEVAKVTQGVRYSIVCDVSVAGVEDFTLPYPKPDYSSDEECDVGPDFF